MTEVSTNEPSPRQRALVMRMWKAFTYYAECSTIHSIKYIGLRKIHWFERIFWLVAFLISLSTCSYLTYQTYMKWDRDPVLVTFNERATPAWKIPFPAITICSESKFNVEKFDIKKFIELKSNNDAFISPSDESALSVVHQICDNVVFKFKRYKQNKGSDRITDRIKKATHHHNVLSTYNYQNFIADMDNISVNFASLSEACQDVCSNFSESFHKIITEEGVCYVYNFLKSEEMYKKLMTPSLAFPKHNTTSNWTLFGYGNMNVSTYPRRILGAGKFNGIKLKLKMRKKDVSYSCKEAVDGFRISFHTPGEFPRPSSQFIRIPFEEETLINIKPRGMTTSDNLRDYSPKKRQCYFRGEKQLNFFKIYTQSNCQLECFANFTLNRIKCVPFSIPHALGTPICGHMDLKRLSSLRKEMFLEELQSEILETIDDDKEESDEKINAETAELRAESLLDERHASETNLQKDLSDCECLPSCSSIDYDTEISQTNLDFKQYKNWVKDESTNDTIYAFITIVIKEEQFIESKRSELYGWTNFLSSCGGFLGLLMGGSLLSLVEIFYHVVLKRIFKR